MERREYASGLSLGRTIVVVTAIAVGALALASQVFENDTWSGRYESDEVLAALNAQGLDVFRVGPPAEGEAILRSGRGDFTVLVLNSDRRAREYLLQHTSLDLGTFALRQSNVFMVEDGEANAHLSEETRARLARAADALAPS